MPRGRWLERVGPLAFLARGWSKRPLEVTSPLSTYRFSVLPRRPSLQGIPVSQRCYTLCREICQRQGTFFCCGSTHKDGQVTAWPCLVSPLVAGLGCVTPNSRTGSPLRSNQVILACRTIIDALAKARTCRGDRTTPGLHNLVRSHWHFS